jgi:hypothetical protein
MATFTMTMGGVTSAAKTIAAGDVTRLLTALKGRFNLPGGATNQQIIDAAAGWVINELVTQTLNAEWGTASTTAVGNVAGIPIT